MSRRNEVRLAKAIRLLAGTNSEVRKLADRVLANAPLIVGPRTLQRRADEAFGRTGQVTRR